MTVSEPDPNSRSAEGRLDGRVALITGASRGIGRAVALRFAREGADLILSARTQGALEEVDDEIRQLGRQATLVPADLTDYTVIDRMGAAVYERWGRLDILVGNAGLLGMLTPLGHISPEMWDQVIATNLTANWRLIRSSLLLANDLRAESISFPAISTGIFGFPVDRAADIFMKEISSFCSEKQGHPIQRIILVLFDAGTLNTFTASYDDQFNHIREQ